jgi:hypothetical protein
MHGFYRTHAVYVAGPQRGMRGCSNQSVVAVTRNEATLTPPFVPRAGDLISALPGRSVMVSLTVGCAPKRQV